MNPTQDKAKVTRVCAFSAADRREVHVEPDTRGQIGRTGREDGLRDVKREICVHALVCRGLSVPSSLASCATA